VAGKLALPLAPAHVLPTPRPALLDAQAPQAGDRDGRGGCAQGTVGREGGRPPRVGRAHPSRGQVRFSGRNVAEGSS
jgi:hypothetical protein